MGRNKYSQKEIDSISLLLKKKNDATRFHQKRIRHILRTIFEFNISDFNEPGKPFGPQELDAAIRRRAIQILDDATIADMKEKRMRDRQNDLRNSEQQALADGELTDWKAALAEWEEWERTQNSVENASVL